MNYKLHFNQNYKILKERMLEKHKGYWKVQSIHKLKVKLSSKYKTQDYLMLKSIENSSSKYVPPFLSFSSDRINKKRITKINKNKLSFKPNINLFITNEDNKKCEKHNKHTERKKQLYINLYKDFSYEPHLYNKLQFIYMRGKDRTVPRKFTEVVKDCFIMDKYNKLLNNMNYNSLNDFDINKYADNNIKLNDSNYDNYNKLRSLNTGKRKRNIKYFSNKLKHKLSVNTNNSNTAYDGFFRSKKSKGVYTLPSIEV